MTFDDILDQAITMLQRRGRLTYRTLKRQFQLDDEALEDLKFELIEGQRLATDENDTVLIWTGETASGQEVVPLPEGARYLGFIFSRAETADLAEGALREAHRHLRFVIR